MNNEEQKRLDFFALETLVRCMLNGIMMHQPELEHKLVQTFEKSIDQFALRGVETDRIPELRDYMKQRGLQWIASASPSRSQGKAC